jgi:hypothetical protein
MNRLVKAAWQRLAWAAGLVLAGSPCVLAQQVPGRDAAPAQVGDIAFDAHRDRRDFLLCDSAHVYQYYQVSSFFPVGHQARQAYFQQQYHLAAPVPAVTGYVVIRFVLNCRGETDRFRVSTLGLDFQARPFPPAIVAQLLRLTRELRTWQPGRRNGVAVDSYLYLNFILQNGQLRDVSP